MSDSLTYAQLTFDQQTTRKTRERLYSRYGQMRRELARVDADHRINMADSRMRAQYLNFIHDRLLDVHKKKTVIIILRINQHD